MTDTEQRTIDEALSRFTLVRGAGSPDANILARIDVGPGCWDWTGPVSTDGYAIQGIRKVHRVMYSAFVGPLVKGLVIDHTCHSLDTSCPGGRSCIHRRCVNPEHLELVDNATNIRRGRSFNRLKDECGRGHPFTRENTYVDARGSRGCKECRHDAVRRYRSRRSAA